eukprot:3491539-Rhodomonas_salina.1
MPLEAASDAARRALRPYPQACVCGFGAPESTATNRFSAADHAVARAREFDFAVEARAASSVCGRAGCGKCGRAWCRKEEARRHCVGVRARS